STLTYINLLFEHIKDPVLLCRYYLYQLYYALQFKDKESCIEMLDHVQTLEKYGIQENEYNYNLILGLYEYQYGSLNDSLSYYYKAEEVMKKMRKNDDPKFSYYMALTLSRLHKITQSTLYAHGALKQYNQLMDFGRCIDCNQLLGINYNLVGEYNLAIECFHSVLEAANSHKHPEAIMGRTYHNLGNI